MCQYHSNGGSQVLPKTMMENASQMNAPHLQRNGGAKEHCAEVNCICEWEKVVRTTGNGTGFGFKQDHVDCDACPYCDDKCDNVLCMQCAPIDKWSSDNTDDAFASFSLSRRRQHLRLTMKTYTPCQVRRHNTESSMWLVAGSGVYDITPFVRCHPGGVNCLFRNSGGVKDITEDMNFHSKKANRKLREFKVGELRPCPGKMERKKFRSCVENPGTEQCTIC